MHKIVLAAIVVVSIFSAVTVYVGYAGSKNTPVLIKQQSIETVPAAAVSVSNETFTVTYTHDLLFALNQFYLASLDEDVPTDNNFISTMSLLMKRNNYLETGINILKKYIDNPNEVISISAKGSTAGAMQVYVANDKIIQFLRTIDVDNPKTLQEFSYQIAKSSTDSKEGFKLITISAPQVALLFFTPAKEKNPSGLIPYNISKDNRDKIIAEIDDYFGDAINTEGQLNNSLKKSERTYSTILIGVKSIKSNIEYDTYEQSASSTVF